MRLRLRTSATTATALFTGLATLAAALTLPAALGTVPAHAATTGRAAAASGECAAGQLCLWPKADFTGKRQTHELSDTDIESCITLPKGVSAASFANRMGRPVTTYQSAECAETAEYNTYPGGGTWVPRSPYQVRAFKVWER
ncbi:peptidase inhibitor family I36 protein [Streptomyces sp. NRRL S-337]|uniref:peptidase inhibitor family I36 protein n=1 Tax=Streptomyces sp. NRRL S-337 TaxID=1463900 RepID=UPI0004CA6531|nr:peptidase inhibitor family I36 protein [Streptomyces sp. NRRL S-337]